MIVENTAKPLCLWPQFPSHTALLGEMGRRGLSSGKRLSVYSSSSLIVNFMPFFLSLSLLFPFIDFILLDFSFLISSSCRLLQLLTKTRTITLYLCFSCCHQKYKTSGKKATTRFSRLSSVFLFLLLSLVHIRLLFPFSSSFSSPNLASYVSNQYSEQKSIQA